MKRFIVILVSTFLLTSGLALAQNPIEQGNMMLNGQIYMQYQGGDLYEYGDDGVLTISFSPTFGYFASDGVMIGLNAYLFNRTIGDDSYTEYLFGPKIGYYIGTTSSMSDRGSSYFPYFTVFFNIGGYDYNDATVTVTEVGGNFGSIFMVSNGAGIDAALRISYDTHSYRNVSESGFTVQLGIGLTAFVL